MVKHHKCSAKLLIMAAFEIIKGRFVRKIIAVILPVVTTSFALIPKSNDC